MKFKEFVQAADDLAFSKSVSRVTLNIVEQPKTDKLQIVEELMRYDKLGEIKQRFQTVVNTSEKRPVINYEVDYLKAASTFRFLGQPVPDIEDLADYCIVEAAKTMGGGAEAEAKPAVQTPAEVEKEEEEQATDEESKPDPKPKGRSKATTKAKAKTTTAKKSKGKPAKGVKFDRSIEGHMAPTAVILRDLLGADWKTEEQNVTAVTDLIYNQLQGKVEIFAKDGEEVLESYKTFIVDFLTEKLDLASDKAEDSGLEGL